MNFLSKILFILFTISSLLFAGHWESPLNNGSAQITASHGNFNPNNSHTVGFNFSGGNVQCGVLDSETNVNASHKCTDKGKEESTITFSCNNKCRGSFSYRFRSSDSRDYYNYGGKWTNQKPVFLTGNYHNMKENTISAVDIETYDKNGDPLTFSFIESHDTDHDLFNLNSSTGALSFKNAPDFENPIDKDSNNEYIVDVKVTDSSANGGNLFSIQRFHITVTNEAFDFFANKQQSVSVEENDTSFSFDTKESLLTASSLSGEDASLFDIDSAGLITFKTTPNFEIPHDSNEDNIYKVNITGTDSTVLNLTINVTNKDDLEISSSLNINFDENSSSNVSTIQTANATSSVNYSLLSSSDSSKFNLDSSSGELSFIDIPNFENPSDSDSNNSYVLNIKAEQTDNSSLSDIKTVLVSVVNINDSPVISGVADTSVNEDNPYSFTPSVSDEDTADTKVFSITNKPTWASFDENIGVLSGTPTNDDVGTTKAIVISVTDSASAMDSLTAFDLEVVNVNDAPQTTNFTVTTNEDTDHTFILDDFPFNDVDVDNEKLASVLIFQVPSAGKLLKNNVELNVNDEILKEDLEKQIVVFRPEANEHSTPYTTFGFYVNDGNAISNAGTATINVNPVNDAPSIVTNLTDENKVEDFGTFTKSIEISDIDRDNLTLEVSSASDLITLDSSAWTNPMAYASYNGANQTLTINSVANKFGQAQINVKVSDDQGLTDNKNFKVKIPAVLDFPNISDEEIVLNEDFGTYDITLENIDIGAESSGTISVELNDTTIYDVQSPITITSSDNGTKTITLTSKANIYGDTRAKITVDNGVNTPISKEISIKVKAVNDAPQISGTPQKRAAQGSLYSFSPLSSDVDIADTKSFSIINKPSWASFDTTTGALSGTPTNADVGTTNSIIISVKDSADFITSLDAFKIIVSNINDAPTISGTPALTVVENASYSFIPNANDIDEGDILTFSIENKPSWASFDTTTGELSGTANDKNIGLFENIIINVEDLDGAKVSLSSFNLEVLNDADNDGIPDITDDDDDNDGIPDSQDSDDDNDGISDEDEGANETPVRDTDGDGIPDYKDEDSDGDGVKDIDEGTQDSDNDGVPDYRDQDTIGIKDSDGDGIPDSQDSDDDNDGISDEGEGANEVPQRDSDNDGIPDFKDEDSDNDGVKDVIEGDFDSDNDGIPDNIDSDTQGNIDSDNDGIPNAQEGAGEKPFRDSDNDGIPDFKDEDSDNDGILDSQEGNKDSDSDGIPDFRDGDSDNDGILDSLEGNKDTDNDGIPDFLDEDSDNDGKLDKEDGSVDTDNDGILDSIDSDDDNDGIPDLIEGDADIDNDGIPNSKDTDSDGDGKLDSIEANQDSDLDGILDYLDSNDNGSDTPIVNADGTQTSTFKKVEGSGDEKTTKLTTVIDKSMDIVDNDDGSSSVTIYEPDTNIKIKADGGLDILLNGSSGVSSFNVANPGADIKITDPENNLIISTPKYINANGKSCQYDIEVIEDGSVMTTKHYINRGLDSEILTTVIMKIPNSNMQIDSNNQVIHNAKFVNTNSDEVEVTATVACDGSISTVTEFLDDSASSYVAVNKPGSLVVIDTTGEVDTQISLDSNNDNRVKELKFLVNPNSGEITTTKVYSDDTSDEVIYPKGAKVVANNSNIAEVEVDLSNVRVVTIDVKDESNNTIRSRMEVDSSVEDNKIQRTSSGEDGQITTEVSLDNALIVVNNKLDGKIEHMVSVDGKMSQAVSLVEGADTVINSTSVITKLDKSLTTGVKTEVKTDNLGYTEHVLENNAIKTQASLSIVGALTQIINDENNEPKITTSVETINSNNQLLQIKIDANANGSSQHFLNINGKEVSALCEIPGANTEIKTNGEIESIVDLNSDTQTSVKAHFNGGAEHKVKGLDFETLAIFNVLGAKTVIKDTKEVETAVSLKEFMCLTQSEYSLVNVLTDLNGKTRTSFNNYSCSNDSLIKISNTTVNQAFDPGNKVDIERINGQVEIKTTTKLNDSIQF